MKKKISALLLSLALCAGLLAGCGTGETAEAPSDTDVQQVDSLKIAFSPYADSDTITTATEPLEDLLKETLLTKGYDVENVDMTVGTSYTAVGQALSAGSADIGFISGGNYVLFSDDCDVLLTALRYAINKDSDDPKDWNDGTIEENTDEMSTYYRSIILAGPSEKGQALLEKVNNGEELTWDDLSKANWAVLKNSSSAGYIYPTLWLQDHYGKKITDLPNVITLAGYGDAFAQAAAEAVDIVVCYADGRNDYEAAWVLPTGEADPTGKAGMGRTDSIWNELNVIGVTDGIYNDTVAISKESPYYTPELIDALQQCFINIINTDEGQAIFSVYSHTGYAIAKDSDYDGARAALAVVS